MRIGSMAAALLLATALNGVQAIAEDTPSDMAAFHATCSTADTFLLGDVSADLDVPATLEALCVCLGEQFETLPQRDIDVLEADLGLRSTEESHIAYGDYAALKQRGMEALGVCFASPEVEALLP